MFLRQRKLMSNVMITKQHHVTIRNRSYVSVRSNVTCTSCAIPLKKRTALKKLNGM